MEIAGTGSSTAEGKGERKIATKVTLYAHGKLVDNFSQTRSMLNAL